MTAIEYISDPFTFGSGGVAAGLPVTVLHAGTDIRAELFTAAGASKVNPVRTDGSGVATFWIEPGSYDLLANGVRDNVTIGGGAGTTLEGHIAATLGVHGIPNTSLLETQSGSQAKANAAGAAAVVTAAANASGLYTPTTDPRLSDARTPTSHAASHASAGGDAIALAQSQVTGLAAALGLKADTTTVNAALVLKADLTAVTAGLAAKADLVGGLVPTSQIPALALNTRVAVANQAAMLALTSAQVQPGDVAVRADGAGTFMLMSADPSQLANWGLLNSPTDVVTTVNGQQGTVVLGKTDIGLGNLDNTSDVNKPVSTATQTALNLKANSASPAFTGTPTGLTASHVGLGNVDNTSDPNKPVSAATQTALNGKQPLDADLTAIAALTATTDNIIQSSGSAWASRTPAQVKTALALNSLDNTSDAGKPVSTAQQTALNLKADKNNLPRSVRDHGAVGDAVIGGGGTDDTSAIQAALNVGPGVVTLTGFHKISSPGLTIPADVWLRGFGESTGLIGPNNYNYNMIRIDNTNGRVSDLAIKRASGGTASGVGVAVLGNSDGAIVERVVVSNSGSGFRSAGELGAVSGTATRVTFNDCIAKASEAYGFEVDNTDGIVLNNPQSVVSFLDGIKLRRKTKNVQVFGGYLTGSDTGDGMDAYAGGDQFTIVGTVFSGNDINGLTIKNDDLNRTDPANYGYVRNFAITGCIASNNIGNGFTAHRSSGSPDDPTEPLVARGVFTACQAHDNGNQGYYLQSRQISLVACTASRNGMVGFYLEPVCRDITLVACVAAGNSNPAHGGTTNLRDGFVIDGSRIKVLGCSSNGADPDGAVDDAAVAAGTKNQRYGFLIQAAATEVEWIANTGLNNGTLDFSDLSGKVIYYTPSGGARADSTVSRYFTQNGSRSATAQTISVEYAVAQWIEAPCVINKLGCEITVLTVGGIIRLGVRACTAYNQPGAILGQTSVASTAVATVENAGNLGIVIPKPGWYYFTSKAEVAAGTVRMCSGPTGGPSSSTSLANALGATANGGYITAALADGVLTDPYTISNRAGLMPIVAWRQ